MKFSCRGRNFRPESWIPRIDDGRQDQEHLMVDLEFLGTYNFVHVHDLISLSNGKIFFKKNLCYIWGLNVRFTLDPNTYFSCPYWTYILDIQHWICSLLSQ